VTALPVGTSGSGKESAGSPNAANAVEDQFAETRGRAGVQRTMSSATVAARHGAMTLSIYVTDGIAGAFLRRHSPTIRW
jgi:hypothetical protein